MHVYQSEHVFRGIRKGAVKNDFKLRHVYLSDRTTPWNNSDLAKRILMKFYIVEFYYKSVEIIRFLVKIRQKHILHIKADTYF